MYNKESLYSAKYVVKIRWKGSNVIYKGYKIKKMLTKIQSLFDSSSKLKRNAEL